MKKTMIVLCFLLLSTVTGGCWNLREPNQLAIVIAAGLDASEDGRLKVSSQIAIPAGLSAEDSNAGRNRSFVVVSAYGKDFMDAGQNIQTQLSRTLFYAHRQTILIGQRMAQNGLAKHGIHRYLDMIVRNPKSEIRSVIWIVKDGEAKDILGTKPVFDPLLSTALSSIQMSLGMKPYYYREFLADSLTHGGAILLPAISLQRSSTKFVYTGAAVLNKEAELRLSGYLNPLESYYANWITGRQRMLTVTALQSQGAGSSISIRVKPLKRHVSVYKDKQGMRVHIRLHGNGDIVENNTLLDPSNAKDLHIIQDQLGKVANQAVAHLIDKAQKQYKVDFLGIGEHVHRKYPQEWKSLQKDWNATFAKLPITAEVHLRYQDPGQTNSSM
ncbi:Ger(x)C family spore germination protein [Paenibacillus sacheonensis]|uniref:Ger(X)C family spore germination protein n=1 Tax=Paenibacillus sacheonensis TaxID=742054 RepID=A0A7X4YVN2_9BACL|nr:Ger(x)C family spore germination protein [Paenibacillus sacheonensis]MBM7569456.1 spore germination protein KC [Paenibacillus sacheonensis]NBC73375.1 Ger(x)C family spore germination protein [Paenibacillus sacheonensis]